MLQTDTVMWEKLSTANCARDWLVGWVYGISTFVGYLTPNTFYVNSQLYFKQFSLAWVHSFIVKTVLIQLIQFSIRIDFVYTYLNVKTVPYQIIQFSVSTVSMSKTVPNNSV